MDIVEIRKSIKKCGERSYVEGIVDAIINARVPEDVVTIADLFKYSNNNASPANPEDVKRFINNVLYKDFCDIYGKDLSSFEGTPEYATKVKELMDNFLKLNSNKRGFKFDTNTLYSTDEYMKDNMKLSLNVAGKDIIPVMEAIYEGLKKNKVNCRFSIPYFANFNNGLVDSIVLEIPATYLETVVNIIEELPLSIKNMINKPSPINGELTPFIGYNSWSEFFKLDDRARLLERIENALNLTITQLIIANPVEVMADGVKINDYRRDADNQLFADLNILKRFIDIDPYNRKAFMDNIIYNMTKEFDTASIFISEELEYELDSLFPNSRTYDVIVTSKPFPSFDQEELEAQAEAEKMRKEQEAKLEQAQNDEENNYDNFIDKLVDDAVAQYDIENNEEEQNHEEEVKAEETKLDETPVEEPSNEEEKAEESKEQEKGFFAGLIDDMSKDMEAHPEKYEFMTGNSGESAQQDETPAEEVVPEEVDPNQALVEEFNNRGKSTESYLDSLLGDMANTQENQAAVNVVPLEEEVSKETENTEETSNLSEEEINASVEDTIKNAEFANDMPEGGVSVDSAVATLTEAQVNGNSEVVSQDVEDAAKVLLQQAEEAENLLAQMSGNSELDDLISQSEEVQFETVDETKVEENIATPVIPSDVADDVATKYDFKPFAAAPASNADNTNSEQPDNSGNDYMQEDELMEEEISNLVTTQIDVGISPEKTLEYASLITDSSILAELVPGTDFTMLKYFEDNLLLSRIKPNENYKLYNEDVVSGSVFAKDILVPYIMEHGNVPLGDIINAYILESVPKIEGEEKGRKRGFFGLFRSKK